MTPALELDLAVCVACEACEAACRFIHTRPRIRMSRPLSAPPRPTFCRQCPDPLCQTACPHEAVSRRDDGTIRFDRLECAHCLTRDCVRACPHGAVFAVPTKAAPVLCDLCRTRRKAGLAPACTLVCPTGALRTAEEVARTACRLRSAAAKPA